MINSVKDIKLRIKELEEELAQLKAQIPAHSIKPEMLMRIEDIEAELEYLKGEH